MTPQKESALQSNSENKETVSVVEEKVVANEIDNNEEIKNANVNIIDNNVESKNSDVNVVEDKIADKDVSNGNTDEHATFFSEEKKSEEDEDLEEKDVHLIEGHDLYHVTEDENKEHVMHERFHPDIKSVLLIMVFVLLISVVILVVMLKQNMADFTESERVAEGLKEQNKTLIEEYETLKKETDELIEKNKLLSDTVNAKNEAIGKLETEKADLHIPFSYPLKGTAAIKDGENQDEETVTDDQNNDENNDSTVDNEEGDYNTIVYFVCDAGTRVIATGSGIIESVTKHDSEQEVTGHLDIMGNFILDERYDTYEIVIDHENGYKTKYIASGSLVVDQGDTVSKGSVIMFIEQSNTTFGYEVELEGELIDPLSCMEISG